LRAVEGVNVYDPVRAIDVYLVPNIVVPKKFRVPDFVKYTRLECLNIYLRPYCNKRAKVIHDDKLLTHFFQDSLTSSTLSWYMILDNARIKKWSDLANAFLRQYKFNIDISPDRTSLMIMDKSNKKTVREYAHKRKNKVLHVQPSLLEKEMVTLFTNTFKSPYYEYLMGSFAQHLCDVVVIAKRIEKGVRADKISKPTEKNRVCREKERC
jgi:hypothetical protein